MQAPWILYLEDEEDLAQEVIAELTDLGIKVTHCDEYTAGIIKATNQKYDLIIADIHLKRGTGEKLIKVIKCNPQHINYKTPALIVSSQITQNTIMSLGRDIKHAIVKPFKLEELANMVLKILNFKPKS